MNPVLLLPAALAALAALELPLLIHLARRQQQRPTMFAALRWLRAQPRPRRRLRFDEPWLLALRLLLLTLLALFLARPALLGVSDLQPRLLVAPGVDAAAIDEARADAAVDARWLAPGFPALDQPPPQGGIPFASLLREFDAGLAPGAPLAVLVSQRLAGADGGRLRLTREVEWRVAPGGDWPEPATIPAPSMAIRHDAAHREGARYLRALAQAWQDETDARIDVAEAASLPGGEADLVAWLREDPLPGEWLAWVRQGGQALLPAGAPWPAEAEGVVVWRDEAGAPLLVAVPQGEGRLLRFTRPLAPAAMPQLLEPGFPTALREVLQPLPAPTAVAAADYAPETGAPPSASAPHDLRPWFALAIALLFLLERWLASGRRRGAMA